MHDIKTRMQLARDGFVVARHQEKGHRGILQHCFENITNGVACSRADFVGCNFELLFVAQMVAKLFPGPAAAVTEKNDRFFSLLLFGFCLRLKSLLLIRLKHVYHR